MRVQRVVLPLMLCSAIALVASCGSAPVKEQSVISLNEQQVAEMTDYNNLLSVYKNGKQALAGKDATKYASDFAALKRVGEKLAQLRLNELKEQFDAARMSTGLVPYAVLKPAQDEVASPPASAEVWKPVADFVQAESKKVTAASSELEKNLSSQGLSDEERLLSMDDLYRITGDKSWLDKRNAFVDQLVEEIRAAQAAGKLDSELQPKIDLVLENRGDDAQLKKELVSVTAEIYKLDYFKALGEGNADKAYAIFVKMSESKNFNDIKKSLSDVTEKMANYFIAEADESVKDAANVSQSYRWYSQARTVSKKLGLKNKKLAGHKTLVAQLDKRYQALVKDGNHTIALAYLLAIEEFSPLHKGLRQKLKETQENVRAEAVPSLSITAFSGGSNGSYGDVISSKITQHLFEHVPNDVRIIEREQYEALQRERELEGGSAAMSGVDLLVTGSVQEAQVEEEKQKGKKTVRAIVGKETITNQAYIKWLELSAKDRKKIEKPSETITIDKEENVPIHETRHRKVGIFSVSYRLVDAQTTRVLFPDSHTEKEEYTGVSQEGVELGDFKREFKIANLPSDVSILDSLATKVSETIGSRLVEKLKDQEVKYLAQAEEHKKDDSCVQYADSLAKALVIMQAKNLDSDMVFDKYKSSAISCGF